MSRVVVTDVDSTLIRNEVIELLAAAAGTAALERVAQVTDRAMRGELDFAASLAERVRALEGLHTSVIDEAISEVVVTDGVREFIAAVHERGGVVAAVSGGFHEVLDPIAEDLGLDHWIANRLETEGGRLTGRTLGPVIDADAKQRELVALAKSKGFPLSKTVAVGDGANDQLMMAVAGVSVAFCAKPAVRATADVCVDVPDFRQLIPLL